jgi:hypothetical protein
MLKYCGSVADRLLEMLVPRAVAGACPCGDNYCTRQVCANDWEGNVKFWHHYTNCHCVIVSRNCDCY